ncbi:hypothetical protein ACFL6U_21535 [Planctomycetota bacterium]
MKSTKKKLRLNKKQTTRLLELGLQSDSELPQSNADTLKEQLLVDALRSKLPIDQALEEALPAMIQSLARELESLSGSSLGELLTSPETSTEILVKIKDHAKERGNTAQKETEREIALAVYYAAIAAALVHHNTKISEHTDQNLKNAFNKLEQHAWMPTNLRTLFQEANTHHTTET